MKNNESIIENNYDLHDAIRDGDIEKIRNLLDNNYDLNLEDDQEQTPIQTLIHNHYLYKDNLLEIVSLLIDRGASVNQALFTAFTTRQTNLVQFLINKAADVNAVNESGYTYLHFVSSLPKDDQLEIVKSLINKGANVNANTEDSIGVLAHLAQSSSIEVIQLLIDNDAKVYDDALTNAVGKKNDIKVIKLLIDNRQPVETKFGQDGLLATAIERKYNIEVIKLLLDNDVEINVTDRWKNTPLSLAIKKKDMKLVELLLKKGADTKGAFPTSEKDGLFELITEIYESEDDKNKSDAIEILELLVEAGIDINHKTELYNTALLENAIYYNRPNDQVIPVIKILLKAQDIDTNQIYKALLLSIKDNNIELIELLLSCNSDINQKDYHNETLIHIAVKEKSYEMINLLLQRNDININSLSYDSKRAIDLVDRNKSEFDKIIKLLRDYGSVEPKEPIKSINIEQKLILEPGTAPDGNSNNKIAVIDLLKEIIKKYPLTDEQIDQAIIKFQNDNIEQNKINSILNPLFKDMIAAWGTESVGNDNQLIRINNVEAVIKRLSEMTDVEDRLPVHWNFKQVLGTIVHIIGNDTKLQNDLTDTLREITLCNLSKLMHLIYVVQDQIIEDQNVIDYTKVNLEDFKEVSDASANVISSLDEQAPLDFIKWLSDQTNKITPEDWSLSTQKIQGIFNKIFSEIFPKINIDSYHYTDGLNKLFIENFVALIKAEKIDEPLLELWSNIIAKGEEFFISNYLDEILKGNVELESLEEAAFSREMNFGNFSKLSIQTIKTYIDLLGDKAEEFLELLKENCVLSDEAKNYINHILNNTNVSNQELYIDNPPTLTLDNNSADISLGGEENTVGPGMYQID